MTTDEIWEQSLSKIKETVGSSIVDLWFKPIILSQIKDKTATIEIPNRFFKEWIEDAYPNLIK